MLRGCVGGMSTSWLRDALYSSRLQCRVPRLFSALVLRGAAPKTGGRPKQAHAAGAAVSRATRKQYRVHAELVLLTYSTFKDLAQFHRLVSFVRGNLKSWGVKLWGATLEAYETDGLHAHLVLQFGAMVDKTARCFAFEGTVPNVSKGDYLGEGRPGS